VRSEGAPLAPSDETTAIFRHQGLPMIDALLANLSPSGTKVPLEGIQHVRLVEHLPLSFADRSALPGEPGATSVALGQHGAARILAELPVAADGSFQARVPAGVAFRIQPLDASRMALGTMHNRWYYTLPGQILTQGISAATGLRRYGSQCAACHGDPTGAARAPELEPPDVVTAASLSLSRFEQQNPRRPIEPPAVGPSTRIELDFQRDVQPILDRRCVSCHGQTAPAAGLNLSGTPTEHFSRAYDALLAPGTGSGGGRAYVDDGDGRARTSFLIELLTGTELDAPRAVVGGAHPAVGEGAGPLTEDELLSVIRWIELGATFRGTEGTR
jgi:mono/diheme cytochrome c family protein